MKIPIQEIIIDEKTLMAKTYVKGYCYALRFAPDTSIADILATPASDWMPYNEMTGNFEGVTIGELLHRI